MAQFDDSAQQIEYAHDCKLSKLAVLSFLMMVGGFSVFFGGPWKSITMLLPAMAFGVYSWISINNSSGYLKGKFFAITATFIPAIFILTGGALLFAWGIDAEPIADDLSVADLYSADAKYAESFALLQSIAGADTRILAGACEKINTGNISESKSWLSVNRDKISSGWEKTSDARVIIERLDTFAEIADMTDPNMANTPDVFNDLICLSELYSGYVCLQNQLGFGVEAVGHFVKFDSVLRKIRTVARSSMDSTMCSLALSLNVITANYLVNCPDTDQKTLGILAGHFKPVANDCTSVRNGVIFDYLQVKEMIYQAAKRTPGWLVKPNSLCRVFRNHCDDSLAVLGSVDKRNGQRLLVWPKFFPKKISGIEVSVDMEVPVLYRYYSIYGASVIEESVDVFGKRLAVDVNCKVLNDLLMISLNKRLGKEVSLKARAYSDEYVIDSEKRIIFSPGPDGEQNTEDDIKLFIDPSVLKL